MRRTFAAELYSQMLKNKNIYVLVGDLGYGMFDKIRYAFPDRFLNCGASEQSMMGIAVGLALEGKIPVVYSISTFLLYRPFETIRNYINHEKINIKLIGSGRGQDYLHDGFSHWVEEDEIVLDEIFTNIQGCWPELKEDLPEIMAKMFKSSKPWYMNLRR